MWFEKCMAARKNHHCGADSFLILEHLKG